jgi:Copper transport outer membrane protein, MctB
MGYSARYHAASLAAVFLALAIGILIGVGLGNKVYKSARNDLEQSLKSDLAGSRTRADDLQSQLNRERDFSAQIYPALVSNLLRGERIAVVALGAMPDDMKGDIESVVGTDSPTGAKLSEVAVVTEPPDPHALAVAVPGGSPARKVVHDPAALAALARRAGRSLVTGGPLFDHLHDALLADVSGRPGGIDAVIVIRDRPSDLGSGQSDATDSLEGGLLDGIEGAGGVPVVGVERSDSDGSQVAFYDSEGVTATVDSIDLESGRVALAYALAGAEGDYGIKASADRLLPALGRPPALKIGRTFR